MMSSSRPLFPVVAVMVFTALSCVSPAQQLNKDDSVARPTPQYAIPTMPANPALPNIWIVGDSTAQNKKDWGWGDHFAHYVDTSRINVVNRARGGRSSRTFIHEGAWDEVLKSVKPGDYVLIQMGHNDGGALDGAKPRGTLKGIGDEQQEVTLLDGTHEVVHTFGWYVRKYIDDARAKGAHPMLLSLTIRNIWTDGHIERDMGYDGFIHQVAEQEKVPYVDMSDVEADRLEKMGPEKTAAFFPGDHTHTAPDGAEMVASCVAEALKEQHTDLAQYVK
ncbi:MAG: rhamnogalacturonan acetylesterase [Edaphobacter sp.]|uniref:rhamnogalacturonan acetylesterase n=1 Tax=Edaphobacter sp. TaxID=1934404 RepID=UPI0023979562|nr:rhamnogalacturonan acetylesterase [Edaphobacter sp.]MDE1176599.1 rhamnogalacturonan acetylesterase [Edaphobacter sp.]